MAREGVGVYGEGRPIGRPSTQMPGPPYFSNSAREWAVYCLGRGFSLRQGLHFARQGGLQVRTQTWCEAWRRELARMDETGRLPQP